MKNFIKKSCLLLLGAVLMTGDAQSVLASEENNEDRPELVIGCDEYEPYNYLDENGNLVGIDADLAEEACHRMGYEPLYLLSRWTEKEGYLEDGVTDCIWDAYSLNGREDDYLWSDPYMYSEVAVIVSEDSPIRDLDDLNDKNIATLVNMRAEDILLQTEISPAISAKNVYSFQLMAECLAALRQGYVDAVVGDRIYLENYIKNYQGKFRLLDENLEKIGLAVAFSKNADPELTGKLNETLKEMKQDGTVDEILAKYGAETQAAVNEGNSNNISEGENSEQ